MTVSSRELNALEKSLLALAAILLLARFVNLHYDTPLFFSHYGQSEITDPYMYTSFPRNAVLFDSWDPYHYDRWASWRVSLSALAAYPAFLITGVSRTAANISSVALQTLGLVLFVLGWRRRRTAAEAAWLGLFLAASSLLFTTSRAPFLENGLIFTSGALFYLHARWRSAVWAPVACGALIAIGAYSAKLVSLALCAPLVVDYFFSDRRRALRDCASLGVGLAGVTVLYAALFYDGFVTGMFAYYTEQLGSVGLAPMADKSPENLLEALLTFGATGGMSRFQPFVIALALVGAVLVVSRIVGGKSDERSSLRTPLFVLVWIVAGALPLVPFEYRPYRYLEPLILPLAALAALAVTALLGGDLRLSLRRRRWPALAILSLGSLMFVGAQVYSGYHQLQAGKPTWVPLSGSVMGLLFVISAALVGLVYLRPITLRAPVRLGAVGALIGGMLVYQGSLLYAAVFQPRAPLQTQSRELGELLNSRGALIAGNYAPQITIDNNLRSLIYPFGVETVDREIFERYPITHIAALEPIAQRAQARFAAASKAVEVARVWVRGGSFVIYELQRPGYQVTDFEAGMRHKAAGRYDSALVSFTRAVADYPDNFTARVELALALAQTGDTAAATREALTLQERTGDLYFAHYLVGRLFFTLSSGGVDPLMLNRTAAAFARAGELNPAFARTMKLQEQIARIETYLRRTGAANWRP